MVTLSIHSQAIGSAADMDWDPGMETILSHTMIEKDEKIATKIGVGIGVIPDYEGSNDYTAVPIPFARIDSNTGQYIGLLGTTIRANVLESKMWSLGPVLRYRFERDDVEDDAVDDLRKVDDALEVGAFAGIKIDRWTAMIEAAQDVADGHEGMIVTLVAGYSMPLDTGLMLSINASTTYASDDYMEAYFEIDKNNAARSGLDVFKADSGIKDYGVRIGLDYVIDRQWSLIGALGYKRLVSDAKDSPVADDVGDANQYLGGVVAVYNF
jgi:outer membrane protein